MISYASVADEPIAVERRSLGQRLREIADPLAKALDLELVDVECQGRGSHAVVRVTIDKVGGVGIKDCEHLHYSLSRALDVADPIPHAYRLEVSSPGLDRPFKHPDDYRRALEKLVWVKLRQPAHGQWVHVGRLTEVDDQGIVILLRDAKRLQRVEITWALIDKARLEVEF